MFQNIKCVNVLLTISLGLGQDMPTDQWPLSRTKLMAFRLSQARPDQTKLNKRSLKKKG